MRVGVPCGGSRPARLTSQQAPFPAPTSACRRPAPVLPPAPLTPEAYSHHQGLFPFLQTPRGPCPRQMCGPGGPGPRAVTAGLPPGPHRPHLRQSPCHKGAWLRSSELRVESNPGRAKGKPHRPHSACGVWTRKLGRGPCRPGRGTASRWAPWRGEADQGHGALCSEGLIEWDFGFSFTGYCDFPIILLCKFLGASAESGGKPSSHCEV